MGAALYDMHCHLDFAPNMLEAAREIERLGACAFAVTVEPSGFLSAREALAASGLGGAVLLGVGLHPWWVAEARIGKDGVGHACELLSESLYVGEVGLDFGRVHGASQEARDAQVAAFRQIARECARLGGRVLSIHAVASAGAVLDILEEEGALASCTCIFHWYSDSSQALTRALRAGCYVSVGSFMVNTRKGREYARSVPAERLLLETDYPPEGECYDVSAMQAQMAGVLTEVAQLRGVDAGALAETVAATSRSVLALA